MVPNVSFGAEELVCGTDEDFDEENGDGAYAKNVAKTLADWGIAPGVGDDAAMMINDDVSDLVVNFQVRLGTCGLLRATSHSKLLIG